MKGARSKNESEIGCTLRTDTCSGWSRPSVWGGGQIGGRQKVSIV